MPQGAGKLGKGRGRGGGGKGRAQHTGKGRSKKQQKRGKRENKKGRVFRPSKFKQGKMAKRKAQKKLTATINRNIEAMMAAKVLASGTQLSLSSLSRAGARQINVDRNARDKKQKKFKTKEDMAEKALKQYDKRQSQAALKKQHGGARGGGGSEGGSVSGMADRLLNNK